MSFFASIHHLMMQWMHIYIFPSIVYEEFIVMRFIHIFLSLSIKQFPCQL